ncbi:MAG: translation initiation factor IF-2 subunit alpha [Candidatus Aenigmatarchaeota archaeon]
MVKHSAKFPEPGELVLGRVARVNPFSALVALEEYPGVEGMVHISEVARKWIKDIRDFVKEGQQVVARVMRVEADKGHVALSLKRVSDNEAAGKLKEVRREQRAEKMLEQAAREMNVSLTEAYKQAGFKLQESFGELWKGFESSMSPSGRELLEKKGLDKKWIAALQIVADKTIIIKEVELKGALQISSNAPNGVDIVREALVKAREKGCDVRYISAPKYILSLNTKDAKKGEKKLQETADAAVAAVKAAGGEGSFTRID